MRQTQLFTKEIFSNLLFSSGLEEETLIETSKKLLYLAQNFEKELPGLHNLKNICIPELDKFIQQWMECWLLPIGVIEPYGN